MNPANPHSTPPPAPRPIPCPVILAPESNPPTPWRRWTNFWFPKSDPTTLAFIRICTGLLVFYIHLAYSLDLQNFFGKHGWYALSFIDRERREGPSYIAPFSADWDDNFSVAQLSEFPHRRKAFMEFLRALPEDPRQRELALKYLNRMSSLESSENFTKAMLYIQWMETQQDMHYYLDALVDREVKTSDRKEDLSKLYKMNTPKFLFELPLEERLAVAAEAGAFWDTLKRQRFSDEDGRKFVLNYFIEVSPQMRRALVDFINTLPEDPAARKKRLDFMEYWNSDSRKAHQIGHGIFSFWFHVTDPTSMAAIHAGVLVLILLFTIGLFTRVTSVLVWIATVCYIHRTQQILFGMDTMMNIILFYLMIGNSGAALSIDRLIARYRASRASLLRSGGIDANTRAFLACPPPSSSAGLGLRLIQIHFCFIYMAAGLSKLKGAAWWEGKAFWDVIANPEFTLMPYSFYEKGLQWMVTNKAFYYTVTIITCWFTLFIEIGAPFLLWTRLRWFMILSATTMHAIIAVLMGLNLFELLMIIMLVAFFPDRVVRDRFRGGLDLVRMALTYNPQKRSHTQAVARLLTVDIDNQIALNADKSADVVSISPGPNEEEKSATGAAGAASVFKHLRLLQWLSPVVWIPGVKGFLVHRLFPSAETAIKGSGLKEPAQAGAR